MSLVLARIDERLIHGQVSIGWVPVLDVDHILVADDEIASDDWERDMVISAAPPEVTVDVLTVAEAARRLSAAVSGRVMLLVRSLPAFLGLIRLGAEIKQVNVGGLHYRAGARRFLDYLYLTPEDVDALRGLKAEGVQLSARDLPGNPEIDLNAQLADGKLDYDRLPDGP